MIKEKTGTKVGGVILSLVINFTSFIGVFALVLGLTFLNLNYYRDLLVTDTMVDCFYEYFDDNVDIFDEYSFDGEDVYTKDFVKHFMKDYIDAAFLGEKNFNEDYYEDYFNDTIVPLLEDEYDTRFSPKEIKKERSKFIEGLQKGFSEVEVDESFNEVKDAGNGAKAVSFVFLAITIGLSVLMICIYRNKFRAARNICITLTISTFVNFMAFFGLKSMFAEALEESANSGDIEDYLMPLYNEIKSSFLSTPVAILGGALALLIVGIIAFSILASKKKADPDEEDMLRATPYAVAPMGGYNPNPYGAPYQQFQNPYQQNGYAQPQSNPYQQPSWPQQPVQPTPAESSITPAQPANIYATNSLDIPSMGPIDDSWTCPNGHSGNTTPFCIYCGAKRPE